MIAGLADSYRVVVTRAAGAGDRAMIKPRSGETGGCVTIVANRVGGDMPGIFTWCPYSVMALST